MNLYIFKTFLRKNETKLFCEENGCDSVKDWLISWTEILHEDNFPSEFKFFRPVVYFDGTKPGKSDILCSEYASFGSIPALNKYFNNLYGPTALKRMQQHVHKIVNSDNPTYRYIEQNVVTLSRCQEFLNREIDVVNDDFNAYGFTDSNMCEGVMTSDDYPNDPSQKDLVCHLLVTEF